MALDNITTPEIDVRADRSTPGRAQNTITNFLAAVKTSGLSKPNRFEVIIDNPICLLQSNFGREVGMFADNAFLPQTRILTSRQQLFGPPEFFPVGVDYGGDNMGINFIVDREMKVKSYFDTWVDGVVNRTPSNQAWHTTKYRDNYVTTMTINQLDESDRVTYSVTCYELFPVSVNPLILDNNLANTVHKLNVTFSYRRWKSNVIGSTESPEQTKSIFDYFNFFGGANSVSPFGLSPQQILPQLINAGSTRYTGTGADSYFLFR